MLTAEGYLKIRNFEQSQIQEFTDSFGIDPKSQDFSIEVLDEFIAAYKDQKKAEFKEKVDSVMTKLKDSCAGKREFDRIITIIYIYFIRLAEAEQGQRLYLRIDLEELSSGSFDQESSQIVPLKRNTDKIEFYLREFCSLVNLQCRPQGRFLELSVIVFRRIKHFDELFKILHEMKDEGYFEDDIPFAKISKKVKKSVSGGRRSQGGEGTPRTPTTPTTPTTPQTATIPSTPMTNGAGREPQGAMAEVGDLQNQNSNHLSLSKDVAYYNAIDDDEDSWSSMFEISDKKRPNVGQNQQNGQENEHQRNKEDQSEAMLPNNQSVSNILPSSFKKKSEASFFADMSQKSSKRKKSENKDQQDIEDRFSYKIDNNREAKMVSGSAVSHFDQLREYRRKQERRSRLAQKREIMTMQHLTSRIDKEDQKALGKECLRLTNEFRAKHGKGALEWEDSMFEIGKTIRL